MEAILPNLTSKVLEILNENDKVTIDVVIGLKYQASIMDEPSIIYSDERLNIHHEPRNIAELMFNADLVITSPGISMFEAIFVGTPIISINQNSLQKQIYNPLNYEFFLDKKNIKSLNHYLNIISPIEKRSEIVRNFKKMKIGEGKDEIISKLSETIKSKELQTHIQNIKKGYETHLLKQDVNSPELVHFKNMRKTNLRFEILTEIADLNNKKILDFGCGNALLKDFIECNNINCDYYGWDISDKMIEIAKIRHPNDNFKVVDVLNDNLSNFDNYFDFIIISGVFNGKLNKKSEDIHKKWVEETLLKLWPLCKNGISINFLTEYVDWEEEELYYCRLDDIIPFINTNLSKSFVIRDDYNLFEFSIYICKKSHIYEYSSEEFEIINLNSNNVPIGIINQYVKLRNQNKLNLNTSPVTLEETFNWLSKARVFIKGLINENKLYGVVIIYIDKDYELTFFARDKGKGLGKILLGIADNIAKEKKIDRLWAGTLNNNILAIKSFEVKVEDHRKNR